MGKLKDLSEQRFFRLTAIEVVGRDAQGRAVWLCRCDCGNTATIASRHLVQGSQKTCGCLIGCIPAKPALGLTGKKHPKWRGGKPLVDGYRWLYLAPGMYQAEHRIVAEKALGRKLRAGEVVHHKNGVRTDNRKSNLEVLTRSKHAKEHRLGHSIGSARYIEKCL